MWLFLVFKYIQSTMNCFFNARYYLQILIHWNDCGGSQIIYNVSWLFFFYFFILPVSLSLSIKSWKFLSFSHKFCHYFKDVLEMISISYSYERKINNNNLYIKVKIFFFWDFNIFCRLLIKIINTFKLWSWLKLFSYLIIFSYLPIHQ